MKPHVFLLNHVNHVASEVTIRVHAELRCYLLVKTGQRGRGGEEGAYS